MSRSCPKGISISGAWKNCVLYPANRPGDSIVLRYPSPRPWHQVLDVLGEPLPCVRYDGWGNLTPSGYFKFDLGEPCVPWNELSFFFPFSLSHLYMVNLALECKRRLDLIEGVSLYPKMIIDGVLLAFATSHNRHRIKVYSVAVASASWCVLSNWRSIFDVVHNSASGRL